MRVRRVVATVLLSTAMTLQPWSAARAHVSHTLDAVAPDATPAGAVLQTEEISGGVVYEHDGVVISAFEVDHAPVSPAFGYRIDFHGRSVVLSGDTRPSENLARHAQGVDLLIHEVVSLESMARSGRGGPKMAAVIAHHTTAEQAGELFARLRPRLAVYSHIGQPGATGDDLIPATRHHYAAALEVGEDLMVIDVGASVTVHHPVP